MREKTVVLSATRGPQVMRDGEPVLVNDEPIYERIPTKTVVLREMNGEESMIVDEYVGASPSENLAYKTYAICSVVSLNGEPVSPISNYLEVRSFAKRLTLPETNTLVREFRAFVGELAQDNDPKGSPADPS